jgi:hypothetical protein
MSIQYLLFQSTRDVILAERICRASGTPVKAVAVPRSVSAGCGVALEVESQDLSCVISRLDEAGIGYRAVSPES